MSFPSKKNLNMKFVHLNGDQELLVGFENFVQGVVVENRAALVSTELLTIAKLKALDGFSRAFAPSCLLN